MPEHKPPAKKKSERETTNREGPARHDVDTELPTSPAQDPLADHTPLDGSRSPRPVVEAEPK